MDQSSASFETSLRAYLNEESALIREAHFAGASGSEVVQRRTSLIDRVLREAHGRVESSGPLPALIAVGGYGRGELNPYSDIDIMFLCKGEEDRSRTPELLYLLWDAGLDIGYSVRTIHECVELARQDIKIRTSLLESRLISGKNALYESFLRSMQSDIFYVKPSAYISEKISERNSTRRKFGGSIYLREPNIKEGAGGLRDIHTALWTAIVHFKVAGLSGLVEKRVLTEGQYRVFLRSRNFLWNVRNEIHYLSGRKNDHLTFDLQEQAARDFNYRDSAHLLAVERFMKAYFIHARNIKEFCSIVTDAVLPKPPRPWFQRSQAFGPFSLVGSTLALRMEPEWTGGIDQIMSAFQIAKWHQAVLSDRLKFLIRSCRIDEQDRRSLPASRRFLEILNQPEALSETLTLMKDLRFLAKYIPEFRPIQALARHDYYHRYAVDEHIMLAIRNLQMLWSGRFPSLTALRKAYTGLQKRWILNLAVLIHDLGKAYRAEHEVHGLKIADTVLSRLNIEGDERDRILFLIENHLIMSNLSQRRELNDRKVIANFAGLVKDRENLAMLYLLTYADISAVNPTAWSQWKAVLLQELYQKTLAYFDSTAGIADELQTRIAAASDRIRKAAQEAFRPEEIETFLASMPDQYILYTSSHRVVEHMRMMQSLPHEKLVIRYRHYPEKGYTELTVCAYDAYGMFYRTAGTIAAKNLNILRAQVYTSRNGVMIDTFQITDPEGNLYRYDDAWDTLRLELAEALGRTSRVPEPGLYTNTRQMAAAINPIVEFDNDTSDNFTIIDITARDMVGFLYQVTKTLFDLNLDLASAKIVTEGLRVMDSFYVTDLLHKKITDTVRLGKIKDALRKVVE